MTEVNINLTIKLELNREMENRIAKLLDVLSTSRYEYEDENDEGTDEDDDRD